MPNIEAANYHLRDADMFREFRSGDLRLEDWSRGDSLIGILKRTLGFLYF